MKMLMLLALVACAFAGPTQAQQPPGPQASPNEQALSNRLLQELSQNVQCQAQTIALQTSTAAAGKHTAELEAEVTRLREKYEPAAPAPK